LSTPLTWHGSKKRITYLFYSFKRIYAGSIPAVVDPEVGESTIF